MQLKKIMLYLFTTIILCFGISMPIMHNIRKNKLIKCDVDKRIEFMEKCINKIDLMHKPEQVDTIGVIKQCEETSQNLYCTY